MAKVNAGAKPTKNASIKKTSIKKASIKKASIKKVSGKKASVTKVSVKDNNGGARFKPGRYIVLCLFLVGIGFYFKGNLVQYLSFDALSFEDLRSEELSSDDLGSEDLSSEDLSSEDLSSGGLGFEWPNWQKKPIEFVVVEGELRLLTKQGLADKVSDIVDGDFLNVNLGHLQSQLLLDPWVEAVQVQRVWPSTLQVRVTEHFPIARWDDEGFINRYGNVIYTKDLERLEGLPVLVGDESNSQRLTEQYLNLDKLFSTRELSVTRMVMAKDRTLEIELNQKFVVLLGNKDFMPRITKFIYVYNEHIKNVVERVDRIDLRYRNGMSISWKAPLGSDYVASLIEPNLTANR